MIRKRKIFSNILKKFRLKEIIPLQKNMKEIELKAWITPENEEKIQKFLDTKTTFIGKKEKYDRNFCKAGLEEKNKKIAFRLREEYSENSRKFWVTEKTHYYSDNGVEMNDELEFEVSSGESFEKFVISQGFEMFYTKEKKVHQYVQKISLSQKSKVSQEKADTVTILFEQLEIPKLGKFLEVEIVCDEKFLEQAEQKIVSIFDDLGITSDIEKAPYVVLLGKGRVK